jgi:putative ATP-dependent endonuclease of OLD family
VEGAFMKFEQIAIKNFRNFENIEICISNKNIFFGLNDIGKTNFLYALRYVFDKDIRKNGFLDSDFHRKNVASPIEITVVIDISDTADPDSQKLRAQLKGHSSASRTKFISNLPRSMMLRN